MKYREFLNELPQRRYPVDTDLGFPSKFENSRLVKKILKSDKTVFIESFNNDRNLYRFKNRFVLVDEYYHQIIYYMTWKQKFYKCLNSEVAIETIHWRDRSVFGFSNLTQHVYLDLLLPLTKVIMCDYEHTSPGERFWFRLVETALNKNLKVYYFNFLPTSHIFKNELITINDEFDLKEILLDKTPWGDNMNSQSKRILISSKMLTCR